jgi:outer membrane protein assembly factor BamB
MHALSPTPHNTTRTYPQSGPASAPEVVWSFAAPGERAIVTSAAVGRDGSIYFGCDDGTLYALNKDGKLKWAYPTGGTIRSSPIIRDDQTILFGSHDGFLYALDKEGALRWRYPTQSKISATPVLDDKGDVFFGTHNGWFYALERSGSLKWKRALRHIAIKSGASIGREGNIYVGNENGILFSIRPDGEVAWTYQAGPAVKGAPAIGRDGTVFVASSDWSVYALNHDGHLKWKYKTAWYVTATPVLSFDARLYIGSWDWSVHAVSMHEGVKVWSAQTSPHMAYIAGSALVDKNHIIYVGARDDHLYAFDKNGTILWKLRLDGDVLSAPTLGGDGILLVPTDNGRLYAIREILEF